MVVSKKGVYEPRLARIEDLDTNITWITAAAWPHRRRRPHAQSSHAKVCLYSSTVVVQYTYRSNTRNSGVYTTRGSDRIIRLGRRVKLLG